MFDAMFRSAQTCNSVGGRSATSRGMREIGFNSRIICSTLSPHRSAITTLSVMPRHTVSSADDSTSRTQKHQSGKAGYCYIGEDRGFRSCIKVDEGDKCMSGDIFPSEEICLNPTLRE